MKNNLCIRMLSVALVAGLLFAALSGCVTIKRVPAGPEESSTAVTDTPADTPDVHRPNPSVTTTGTPTKATTTTKRATTTAPKATTTTAKPKPTVPSKPAVKGATKIADYVPNIGAWTMKGIRGSYRDFTFQVQILGKKQYVVRGLERSIDHLRLGDTGYSFGPTVATYEWPTNGACNYGQMPDGSQPTSRAQALQGVRSYLARQIAGKAGPFASMDSFTRWQHYTAEAGYDYIGCEIGANVNASNLSVAFARGAAKQYSEKAGLGSVEAWFVDFSLWNWLGMINYSGDETMHRHNDGFHNNIVNHEYAGQSPDDARRAYYMAYMSGAQWLINEGGAESAFWAASYDKDSVLYKKLSPHGIMNQEFYAFTQQNPDRGVTYTPFAVVINHDHGLPYGHWKVEQNGYKVFERFAMTDGDWMISRLFSMLYPNSYPHQSKDTNDGQQVNTPWGDTVDVLTHTADQSVLNSYPVIILAGDITFTTQDVARYTEYVRQGGTLLLNTAYKRYFTAFSTSKTYGKGRVIVYGEEYKVDALPEILDGLVADLIPFTMDETVQYILNVKDGSLVLTLINNNGVYKEYDKAAAFDDNETLFVNVTYTGSNKVLEVRDWMTGEKRPAAKEQLVELGPGDIAVLEFVV
ncbi:MAG: hypothetical protein IJ518_03375 [Clostridia bacterium]|nr:hypothetical protein [Clostridia bacterium]